MTLFQRVLLLYSSCQHTVIFILFSSFLLLNVDANMHVYHHFILIAYVSRLSYA